MSQTPPLFEDSQESTQKNVLDTVPSVKMKTIKSHIPFDSHTFVIKRAHSQEIADYPASSSSMAPAKKQKIGDDAIIDEKNPDTEKLFEIQGDNECSESPPPEPEDLVRFREQREKMRKIFEDLQNTK